MVRQVTRHQYGGGIWFCLVVVEETKWFDGRLVWRIGERKQARFWFDCWIGKSSLGDKISKIISHFNPTKSPYQGHVPVGEIGWEWCLAWRMELFS